MRSTLAAALCAALSLGCARAVGADDEATLSRAPGSVPGERLLVKTASQVVAVADVAAAASAATSRVESLGGHLAGSSTAGAESARRELRVPAARLDEALAAFAAHGAEKSRSVSAADVTGEVSDLEATLVNQRALRDRLRALLARAEKVDDVLSVERELTRLQTEIDSGEARLARLRTDVALSAVTLQLEKQPRPRILGPLGLLFEGTRWFVEKLFVIRE